MSLPVDLDLRGGCPVPFFEESRFSETGGFIHGRFCSPMPLLLNLTCCLPCPITDWTYHDGFEQRTEIADWVNVGGFISCIFLCLSFAFLPVKWTHRHYLSICLIIAVVLMELAFIVPLFAKPEQCFNEITPNDMGSSGPCAISGVFLLFGGWSAVVWVFLRAVALHLQICWGVIPGKKFFYSSIGFGWLIPALGSTLTLTLTGVSFRFGKTCHVNHKLALQDFWGPLLGFAASAIVFQFITLAYCVQVFLSGWNHRGVVTYSTTQVPTYSIVISAGSVRQSYRRVQQILKLQWRGATIVVLIIAEVAFFSVVFLSMDNNSQVNAELLRKATPWLICLFQTEGNKNQCLGLAGDIVEPEGVVLAVLIALAMSGIWCTLFFGRWSMISGWIHLVKTQLKSSNEFISATARRHPNHLWAYDMLSKTLWKMNSKTIYGSPAKIKVPERPPLPRALDAKQERPYVWPLLSFSVPRPPNVRIFAQIESEANKL